MSLPMRLNAAHATGKATPMRVLVVDDDPIYRETSRMFLSMYGRQVTLADCGTQGIARASEGDFDVMICDLEMPDMTGLEVIAAVKQMQRHQDLPIIMVTSRDDAMAIDRAFELGASSFVVKPVNWTLLDHYVRFVRRAAENEITARRAQAETEALARTKDNLLAVVRHEMKTPLSAIIGFTRLAVESQASGDVAALREQLEFVRDSGERLLASFSDMAIYSDLISQRISPASERVAPSWIIGEVLDHRERKAMAKSVRLVSREECRDTFVAADQSLLTSALVRLVDNALTHATEVSEIVLSDRLNEDGEVEFSVRDNGGGMPSDRIAVCLAPFSQENMSLSRKNEGLGLGLPIAVEIAKLHGGALTMRSEPGKGTEVTIRIPKL